MQTTDVRRPVRAFSLGALISLGLSMPFYWLWYERYLRIEFNELGRYYDAETQTVYTDAAFVWCLPAFGFLALAVANVAYRLLRRHRARTASGITASPLHRFMPRKTPPGSCP